MCEIKLKEPTDGSEIQEGGEVEEAARSAAAKDLQHSSSVLLGDNLTRPVKHWQTAAVFGEARHSYNQSCGNHKCIQDVLGIEPWQRFRDSLSVF